MFYIGCLSFAFFLLGDINDLYLKNKALSLSFPAGFLSLLISTLFQILDGTSPVNQAWGIFFGVLSAVFFGLTVYSLFFAIPPGASYVRPGELRPVQAHGVYALCRHPGVMFFIPLYIFLWPAFGLSIYVALTYCVLDILLITYEDIFVFPKLLSGYGHYKKTTPFLIPNAESIRHYAASFADKSKDVDE